MTPKKQRVPVIDVKTQGLENILDELNMTRHLEQVQSIRTGFESGALTVEAVYEAIAPACPAEHDRLRLVRVITGR